MRTICELSVAQLIRDEAMQLRQMQKIKAAEKNDDAGFNSFFKNDWKRFYLKWYDASHPSVERFCPRTVALLHAIPSVKAAMFAELPTGRGAQHASRPVRRLAALSLEKPTRFKLAWVRALKQFHDLTR